MPANQPPRYPLQPGYPAHTKRPASTPRRPGFQAQRRTLNNSGRPLLPRPPRQTYEDTHEYFPLPQPAALPTTSQASYGTQQASTLRHPSQTAHCQVNYPQTSSNQVNYGAHHTPLPPTARPVTPFWQEFLPKPSTPLPIPYNPLPTSYTHPPTSYIPPPASSPPLLAPAASTGYHSVAPGQVASATPCWTQKRKWDAEEQGKDGEYKHLRMEVGRGGDYSPRNPSALGSAPVAGTAGGLGAPSRPHISASTHALASAQLKRKRAPDDGAGQHKAKHRRHDAPKTVKRDGSGDEGDRDSLFGSGPPENELETLLKTVEWVWRIDKAGLICRMKKVGGGMWGRV